jgi:multidrug efflux pump subunit AcrA (membrane-fusion protein)
LQLADSILHDQAKSKILEPSQGVAGGSVLYVASSAPSKEAGPAWERRSPVAYTSERPAVQPMPTLKRPLPKRPGRVARFAWATLKTMATSLIVAAAALAAVLIWNYYIAAPWTRDGSVRVQVANVAPQVSGQITEIRVVDNQYVHEGDVLYVIDPFDFHVALDAQLRQKAADLQVKRMQAERRQHLTSLSTTPEEQQLYVGNATQAQGAFDAAQRQVAQADINLKRTASAQSGQRLRHQPSNAGG